MRLEEVSVIILSASMSGTPDDTKIDKVRVESTSVEILTKFPISGNLIKMESR